MSDVRHDETELRRRAAAAGQEHVFRFWNDLAPDSRASLLAQLAEIDFDELSDLTDEHVKERRPVELPPDLEPAAFIPLARTEEEFERGRQAVRRGEEIVAAGQVAALVVAGGQGTRLGYEGPKGSFAIGPVSGRPLFQVFAESILADCRKFRAEIPWYVMTSRANDRQTRDFFDAYNYFGLPRSDVRFFTQGMMPAVDFQGRLVLASPGGLAWSPDGHGGTIKALARSGMLSDMASRGIEYISYFQVDNPLVPPVDPLFIGLHAGAESDMSSKMARKRDPLEKLGVFTTSGGRLRVIEYSDLPENLARATNPDGSLRFEAGSIAIHVLSRRFVERLCAGKRFALPFHRAEKKIECVGADGRIVKPREPNGIKFETFVFDALPMAARPLVLEIDRAREFSPVKNSTGLDSPATAQRDMILLAAAMLEQAGVQVPRDAACEPAVKVEVSPLAARDAAELAELVVRLRLHHVAEDLYLGIE